MNDGIPSHSRKIDGIGFGTVTVLVGRGKPLSGLGFRVKPLALALNPKPGVGLYHHLQASTMTEMLAGNGACNGNCNGKERSCNGLVAKL